MSFSGSKLRRTDRLRWMLARGVEVLSHSLVFCRGPSEDWCSRNRRSALMVGEWDQKHGVNGSGQTRHTFGFIPSTILFPDTSKTTNPNPAIISPTPLLLRPSIRLFLPGNFKTRSSIATISINLRFRLARPRLCFELEDRD
ncbi:hypothetical protein MKZ38_008547 [Zalerion maritima]|uniref:Uncharacterized protein n=1 Tax=Zalerion maritima TaxID=339359 RepID=A0AAD5RW39_9PEZI|nr:hypothetical protein MKZ38_008547 [Zalerion maritima]